MQFVLIRITKATIVHLHGYSQYVVQTDASSRIHVPEFNYFVPITHICLDDIYSLVHMKAAPTIDPTDI